jgi:hypothetical protein
MKKLLYIFCIISLFSCKKDPVATPEPLTPVGNYLTNDVMLNVTNFSNSQILQLSKDTIYSSLTPKYINANGDTFSVSTFKYYLSNFRLKKVDGTYFEEQDSHHLLSIIDTSSYCKFALKNVPYGEYVGIDFIIGVDSALNCSGAQSGDLSASNDMFWSWNQGYIFLKFEGYSSSAPAASYHNVEFHVGGYQAPYNNIKKVNLDFAANTMSVGANVPKVYLKADVQKMFTNSSNNINFATTAVVTSPSAARLLSSNYSTMFTLGAVVNQ